MRKFKVFICFLFTALSLRAQTFVNGQAARAVVGQYTFTYGGAVPGLYPTVPGQQLLGAASGLAWANGTLYVTDSNRVAAVPQDNRVLQFNTALIPAPGADLTNAKSYSTYSCNLCGFPAYNQLGQPSFTPPNETSTPTEPFSPGVSNSASTSNMQEPTAVASDGNIVAVADTNNNRVLIWTSVPTSLNQPANLVLGQADFTHGTTPVPPTASSLSGPQGVWIQNNRLFVADTQNYRVLIWNTIPTQNNQPADLVLGQASFNTGTQAACDPTKSTYVSAANELCNPVSVTSDGTHVFVSDLGFSRVLIWNSIPTSNAQNADVVVGQPDMVSAVANNPAVCNGVGIGPQGQCVATLNFPRFALSDGTRLFIADGGNDRVLVFSSIPSSNGASANAVLGQPDFTSDVDTSTPVEFATTTIDNTSGVDVTPSPTSLAFDGSNLYVSDPNNNRVLVFTPGITQLPTNSVLNWASEIIRQEGIVTIAATTITAGDTVTVTIAGTAYAYTVVKTDTADTIAQGLVTAINTGSGDPNVTAIFAGAGSGSLYLSSKGVNLGVDAISLLATASNTADLTVVASGGNLTAGTAATAAPGMLVEINGTNLSSAPSGNPAVATLAGVIPTTLGGSQVFMDGVATPVFSSSATQIISQVPYNFTDRNSTSVYVRTQFSDGSVSITNATPVYIAPANPGLFSAQGTNRPLPAINAYHQAGNPNAVVDITGTVNAGDIATITVNGVAYNYTVQSSDSLFSIVTNLSNAINNAPDPLVTATPGAAFDRVVVTARKPGTAGTGISIAASSSASADITLTAYSSATCCAVIPGSSITANNPAVSGEMITMAGAGLGQVNDPTNTALGFLITGQPYNGPVLNSATNSVSATMGGITAQVVGAGLAPGSYGTYQVQMIVPAGLTQNNATQVYIAQNAYISNIVTLPVGPANSNPFAPPVGKSPITIQIDTPNASSSVVSGLTQVAGWVVDSSVVINSVTVSVDGLNVGTAAYGGNRSDVCTIRGQTPGCPNVGYNYLLDTTQFADGSHTVEVTATDLDGNRLTSGGSFSISNYTTSNPTTIIIDRPGNQTGPFQGSTVFSGWALNANAVVTSVTVSVDGSSLGSATYGMARPDVCAIHAGPGCPSVGWSYLMDTTKFSNGRHMFNVSVTAANGQHAIVSHSFTVANWTTSNPITITVDTPNNNSGPFSGNRVVAGWAIDSDSIILGMSLAVDGVPYGNISYGGNRSDVCAVYPNVPGCPNVGWGILLDTTTLGDGIHTLQVTATPLSGQGYTTTRTFTVANQGSSADATYISIDEPGSQSPSLSGTAPLGGWALNRSAPIATVSILVDGTFNGYANYGGVRNDVCAKYPGVPGCPDVGWNYLLNTQVLTNGTHVLEVTATTTTGQRATSNTAFSVSNSVFTGPTTAVIAVPSAVSNPFQGLAQFSGSAISTSSNIVSISVSVDGYPYGAATYTSETIGVPVNWTYLLNTVQFSDGTHTLGVTATAADGTYSVVSSSFQVANWASPDPMLITIDTPSSSSSNFAGVASFGGWALDGNSSISAISLAVDGVSFGNASYGGVRSDVCAVYPGRSGCPNVGWNAAIDTTYLSNGTHTLAVTASTPNGQSSTVTSTFTVTN